MVFVLRRSVGALVAGCAIAFAGCSTTTDAPTLEPATRTVEPSGLLRIDIYAYGLE